MNASKPHATEIWAQLCLCEKDHARIRDFLVSEFGIKPRYIVKNMHITVYHARRPMPGVSSVREPARVKLAAAETRFMVMAPVRVPGATWIRLSVRSASGYIGRVMPCLPYWPFASACYGTKRRASSGRVLPAPAG
jgi:hypothetical protein